MTSSTKIWQAIIHVHRQCYILVSDGGQQVINHVHDDSFQCIVLYKWKMVHVARLHDLEKNN